MASPITKTEMRFASALTTSTSLPEACQALVDQVESQMEGLDLHLVLTFVSPHFRTVAADLADSLRHRLSPELLIGCTAEGVISRDKEIERSAAITLVAAHLPGVQMSPFALQAASWDDFLADQVSLMNVVGAPPNTKLIMLLADPYTTPMDTVLAAFNHSYPGVPMVGGMASGSARPGGNALFFNQRLLNNGAVGVAFAGAFDVDVVVSQGCRPIGEPVSITSVKENMILSLDYDPPLIRLREIVSDLSEQDRQLLENGLYICRVINDEEDELGRGDFLIRGVMGIDQQSGALVVGDYFENDEVVQFHLRDASTAKEDLEMMLTPQQFYGPPSGGFLFSCNGRGTRLYDHPNGDISTIQRVIGDVSLAGFFCAGEIGPVGGKNFLHGQTASLALFRPAGEWTD
ncbi:MAG TPA: FIST N-terminal domain-containing protein [Anaerolineae bacterium]|nr:FIST N-terminal domain-containing protein [Anaerolineae bacterium]